MKLKKEILHCIYLILGLILVLTLIKASNHNNSPYTNNSLLTESDFQKAHANLQSDLTTHRIKRGSEKEKKNVDVKAKNASLTVSEENSSGETGRNLHWIILYSLVSILITLANVSTILIILSCRKLCNSTNYYVLSLSSAYLLTGLVTLPAYIVLYFYQPNPALACQLGIYLNFLNTVAGLSSIYSIMGVAMDRYYAVMKPFSRRLTQIYVWPIITLIWTMAILTSLPIIIVIKRRMREAQLAQTLATSGPNTSFSGNPGQMVSTNEEMRKLYANLLAFLNSYKQSSNKQGLTGNKHDSNFNSSILGVALFGSDYPHNAKNISKAYFISLIRDFLNNITTIDTSLTLSSNASAFRNDVSNNKTVTIPDHACNLSKREMKILLYFQVSVGCALPLLITTLLYINMACRLWKTTGNHATASTNAPPTVKAAGNDPFISKSRRERNIASLKRALPRDSYIFGRLSQEDTNEIGLRLGGFESCAKSNGSPNVKKRNRFSIKQLLVPLNYRSSSTGMPLTYHSPHASVLSAKGCSTVIDPLQHSDDRLKSVIKDNCQNKLYGDNQNRSLLCVRNINLPNSPDTSRSISSEQQTETTKVCLGSPIKSFLGENKSSSLKRNSLCINSTLDDRDRCSSISMNSPKVVRFSSLIPESSNNMDNLNNEKCFADGGLRLKPDDIVNAHKSIGPLKNDTKVTASGRYGRRRSTTFLTKRPLKPLIEAKSNQTSKRTKKSRYMSLSRFIKPPESGIGDDNRRDSGAGPGVNLVSSAESHRNLRNKQAAKMVLTLVFLYSICNLPFYVFSALNLYDFHMDIVSIHIHNLLIHTDHWLHIAVYLFFNANFRAVFYKRFVQCSWPHFSFSKLLNFCGATCTSCYGIRNLCSLSLSSHASRMSRDLSVRPGGKQRGRRLTKFEEERSNYFSIAQD